MNPIPTFALLTTRMDGWYQAQAWHGATSAARLLGIRLVALVGSAYGDPEKRGGPVDVYDLARFNEFDGYVILTGALSNHTGLGTIHDLLERLPRRPTVSIGMELPGTASVIPDGGGMESIARHLVQAHGLRRFAFISGPESNPDACRRWADWNATLAELGLRQDPALVEFGDFTPESGKAAAEALLAKTEKFQAIVCANDAMALGVRKALTEHGLRIPQDLVLTGYDDIEEARTMVPPLTTVRAETYLVGFRAVEILMDLHRGGDVRQESIATDFVVRRSCGCHLETSTTVVPRLLADSSDLPGPISIRQMLSSPDTRDAFLERLEKMLDTVEFAEIDFWEESLLQAAQPEPPAGSSRTLVAAEAMVSQARHGLDARRRQSLQHLMRVQFQAVQTLTYQIPEGDFTGRILDALQPFAENHLRILLYQADFSPVTAAEARTQPFTLAVDTLTREVGPPVPDSLLPPDDPGSGTWVTLSLALGDEHFGVMQLRDWNTNELFLESLRLALSMLFSGIRKAVRESAVRDELLKLSRRDPLTGLLNRRGLLEQGELLVHSAARTSTRIGIVLCDLDGLKKINDRHGHADGDLAIRCLARALEDCFRQSDVLARLGGDEFAALLMLGPEGGLDTAIVRLREALERRSRELGKPWTAKTSAGWIAWNPGDGQSLDGVLAQADEHLYRDKRRRKSPRG